MRTHFFTFAFFLWLGLVGFAQPTNWTSYGVGGGGAFYAPSINPANANEFYVSSDMSELYHSMDGGATYDLLPFTQINGRHNSQVRFTNVANTRYCISYKMSGASDYYALVKTIDGGATWNEVPNAMDRYSELFSLYVDYNNPNRIVMSDYGSLWYSGDGGLNFTSIHNTANGNGLMVGGAWFDGNNMYVGTNDGIIRSTNAGTTWGIMGITGIPAGQGIISFAAAKQGGQTRFFCITGTLANCWVNMTASGSDYYGIAAGVYRMDLPATNWVAITTGLNLANDFPEFVDCAENDITTCYLAGGCDIGHPRIWKTTNGGNSWANTFLSVNNQNIITGWSGQNGDRGWTYGEVPLGFGVSKSDNNVLFFTDFGFVHKSINGGTAWRQCYVSGADEHPAGAATPIHSSYHSVGVENTTCWQVHWADANNMMSCFSDIRGIRSVDAGVTWSFNYTGHNANSMYRIAQAPNGTMYAATSNVHDMYQSTRLANGNLDANDAEGKIMFSTNMGATWQLMHFFNHPVFWVTIDPNNPNIVYASVIHSTLGGIYMTTNANLGAASTWIKLPNPPRTEGHPATISVLNDGKVLVTYSGHRNPGFTPSSGCFIYDGTSWADVSHPGMYYWTKDVVLDPNDPAQNTWYVCVFSGWGGAPNGLGGLYKTTNRGLSWTKIWNSDRVTSITFNPTTLTEAYLTTETEGLWMSQDMNLPNPTFSFVNNYPFRQPERVFFNPYDTTEIWVTSFGGGLRKGTLAAIVPPVANDHPHLFLDTLTKASLIIKKNTNDPDWIALKAEADNYATRQVMTWSAAAATVWNTNYIFYSYCGSSWDDAAMSLGMTHQLMKGNTTGAFPTPYSNKMLELADTIIAAYYRYPPCNGCTNVFLWNSSYATRHVGNVVSIIYDWCYDELGTPRKTALLNLMNDWFAYARIPYNTYQNDVNPTGNYYFGNVLCAAYMGHATRGDNPMAQQMIDYARQRILGTQSGSLLPGDFSDNFLKETYTGNLPSYCSNSYLGPSTYKNAPQKDGIPVQGWGYGGGTMKRLIDYCYFVKSTTGENIADSLMPYFAKTSEAFIHSMTPNRFQIDNSNDWGSFIGNMLGYDLPLRLTAVTEGTPQGPYAEYFYNNWIEPVVLTAAWNHGYPSLNWENMLYKKAARPSAAFNYNPYYPVPSHFVYNSVPINEGLPKYYMRNNWGKQSTWCALNMSTALYDDHDHDNAGHFQIARGDSHDGDDLLLVGANEVGNGGSFGLNGIEGGTCYHGSSSLCNSLYFDDYQVYSNADPTGLHKGGQTGYGYEDLTHQEQNDTFTYVRACLTSAYHRNGDPTDSINHSLQYFYRSFLYLRDMDVFLSYDNFKAKNSVHPNGQYQKHLRWHFMENPTINGNNVTAVMDNSRLFVHTVLPATVTINKVNESNNPDNTYGGWMNYAFNTYTWRAEVSAPGNPLRQDILTVMQPASLVAAEMVTTTVATIPNNMEGTNIAYAGNNELVLFNKNTTKYQPPITLTSYLFSGPLNTWHTLCGMVPGVKYQVDYDGIKVTVSQNINGNFTSTPSGVLRFQVVPISPLPITELHFIGYENSANNTLEWTCTSNEIFQAVKIERSVDGSSWGQIGTSAFQNSTQTQFNDTHPITEAYYRIGFMDVNGKVTYSDKVKILRIGLSNSEIVVSPNPASHFVNIGFNNINTHLSIDKIVVYDATGKIIQTSFPQSPSSQIDISTWAIGIYFVKIRTNEGEWKETLSFWKY